MKGKKIASVLLSLGMIAAVATTGALVSCKKKDSGPYTGAKATEFVNKTPADKAKVIYIGEASGNQDGSSAENAMGIIKFFNDVRFDDDNKILVPGTIVKVTPGEHLLDSPIRLEKGGAYNDYIIFEAADPTQETVLNFKELSFSSTNRGIELYGDYCYWRNIDICGAGDNGLYIGGSYNIVENCKFYNNRDTGLQLGRCYGTDTNIRDWPSYNLIKNCTSFNNYDNQTYGENADGFAAKLTVGYGNIFDGCIAYRNSDDGWDLYGKDDTGRIGRVILYNCIAFENGFLQHTQKECNEWYGASYNNFFDEANTLSYLTRDGDGNGFKLGGSTLPGDVYVENCLSFNNRMHGLTDNSNPGKIEVHNYTGYNSGALIDNISYIDIHDEEGNTTYKQTSSAVDTEGNMPAVRNYYNVNQDDYIVDENNNKIILDDQGVWRKNLYVALDSDGYIIQDTKTNAYFDGNSETEGVQKIKGHYVKFDKAQSTVNPNFGKILTSGTISEEDDKHNNLDIARTVDSYNAVSGVVSAVSGNENKFTGSDRYRSSVSDSVLLRFSETWGMKQITSAIDADTINKKYGEDKAFVAASEIFEELPANDLGMNEDSFDIHSAWRNEDGSINVGDLLKIKDYGKLLGNDKKIGCDLSKTSWADYPHYDYTYMTDGNYVRNDEEAIIRSVESLLYVQTDINATYQNFQVVTEMLNCKITWATSNADILSIGDSEILGASRHTVAVVDINRPDTDTVVTLTATITSPEGKYTLTKKFDITVKAITYEIGDIEIEGLIGNNVIMKQYAEGGSPKITLHNAADYSGKLVPEDKYSVETTYEFSTTSKNGPFVPKLKFATKDAGIYKAKTVITLGEQTKTFEYMIFVVNDDAELKFMDNGGTPDYSLAMKHDGFNISGTLTNVSGSMYVLATEKGAGAPSKENVKANGEKVDITWDEISFDFKHDNTAEYTVYFVLCNPKGDITSGENPYSVTVEIVEISDETTFMNFATSGGEANKIYQLTKDLDYSGKTWTPAAEANTSNAMRGLFDGKGFTIKNIRSVGGANKKSNSSIFPHLMGGSIMNVKFDNISISGYQEIGIIGNAKGGYLYNIDLHNISADADQRVAALVGYAGEQSYGPLIIDKVRLVNDNAEIAIKGTRSAGILGFVQLGSGTTGKTVDIRISNCYVDASIGGETNKEVGGIFATYDTGNAPDNDYSLSITNCYFAGTAKADSRCGGILGYQKGTKKMVIYGCVNVGKIYHAGGTEPLATPQKNASGIVGGYVSNGDGSVSWCYSNIAEHNSNFDVTLIEDDTLNSESIWSGAMGFDMENTWEFVKDGDGKLTAPYVKLRGDIFRA